MKRTRPHKIKKLSQKINEAREEEREEKKYEEKEIDMDEVIYEDDESQKHAERQKRKAGGEGS